MARGEAALQIARHGGYGRYQQIIDAEPFARGVAILQRIVKAVAVAVEALALRWRLHVGECAVTPGIDNRDYYFICKFHLFMSLEFSLRARLMLSLRAFSSRL